MFLVNIAETTRVQPLSETYMVKLLILSYVYGTVHHLYS